MKGAAGVAAGTVLEVSNAKFGGKFVENLEEEVVPLISSELNFDALAYDEVLRILEEGYGIELDASSLETSNQERAARQTLTWVSKFSPNFIRNLSSMLSENAISDFFDVRDGEGIKIEYVTEEVHQNIFGGRAFWKEQLILVNDQMLKSGVAPVILDHEIGHFYSQCLQCSTLHHLCPKRNIF